MAAYSQDYPQPDSISSWARPITVIKRISLATVDCKEVVERVAEEKQWQWSATATVEFNDGEYLPVPLFGEVRSDRHDEEIRSVLDAITERMR